MERTRYALDAYRAVADWRGAHTKPLSLVTSGVRNWVGQVVEHDVVVGQRLKRMPQIVNKLDRFPTMRLVQMEDIAGCRAVLEDAAQVEDVASRIERQWKIDEVVDYRADGKPGTGYRALHIVVVKEGRFVEVQLRTPAQHSWAEAVEHWAATLGFAMKDGQGPSDLIEYFRVASDIMHLEEQGEPVDEGLEQELRNLQTKAGPFLRRAD